MAAPRRAFVLTLDIGADSRDELRHVLYQLSIEVAMEKLTEGVSGGYGSGYTYKLDVDESITHDSYFEAVDEWLQRTPAPTAQASAQEVDDGE